MSNKLPLDSSYDLEQQFILRMMDPVAAANMTADIEAGISFKENFTVEFKPDTRHSIVRYNGQVYQGCLMDLPCIIESLKTTDKHSFYKTADICQMMVCTQGEDGGPLRGTAAYLDDRARSWRNSFDISRENRQYQFLHGINPPLKNVLHRRFRKTRRKRLVDMPKIEKEVKQLLRADLEAVGVKWEVLWSDPPSSASAALPHETGAGTLAADGDRLATALTATSSGRQVAADDDDEEVTEEDGTRPFAVDRQDVFGDMSSSSGDSSAESSPAASDDENTRSGLKRDVLTGPTASNRSNPDTSLALEDSHVLPNYGTDPTLLGSLKDELAAELLLSDSGDEGTTPNPTGSPHCLSNQDALAEALEVDLQASVAAQLVAHAVGDAESVEVDLDDEDDMMVVHRGGELLDDDDDDTNLMDSLASTDVVDDRRDFLDYDQLN